MAAQHVDGPFGMPVADMDDVPIAGIGQAGHLALVPTPQALNSVERYDGNSDAHAWLASFTEIASLYGWSDAVCLRIARIRMKGSAQNWAMNRQFAHWTDFRQQFLRRFGETRESAIAQFESCFQQDDESPKLFADRFLQNAERAGRVEDDALLFQFTQRLHPHLRTEVARQRLHSIEDIVSFCNYWLGLGLHGGGPLNSKPAAKFTDGRYNTTGGPRAVTGPNYAPVNNNNTSRRFDNRFPRFEERQAGPYKPPHSRPAWNQSGPRTFNRGGPPAGPHTMPDNKSAVNAGSTIDDLSKRFEKLELNMAQQLSDKEKENRQLRHALRQQQGPVPSAHLHYMNATSDEFDDLAEGEDLEIDPLLMSEICEDLMVKRGTNEVDPYSQHMPHKRAAIDPAANSPYAPASRRGYRQPQGPVMRSSPPAVTPTANARGNGTTPAGTVAFENQRLPRQRAPFAAPPYNPNARPTATPGNRTTNQQQPLAAPQAAAVARGNRGTRESAAQLAADKGFDLAAALCKSMKFDANREAAVVPQAVLLCAAGHLIGDNKLIEQGKTVARQVEAIIARLSTAQTTPPPANTMNFAEPAANCSTNVSRLVPGRSSGQFILNRQHVRRPLNRRISTCKVIATLHGQPLEAVIDTGASTSAVTLDCLRRSELDHLVMTDMGCSYVNADGRLTDGKGKVPSIPLGLGEFTTLVAPTVTEALNYDMLIGNDVLSRAHAVIDYGRRKLIVRIDPDTVQELDINFFTSEPSPVAFNTMMMVDSQPEPTRFVPSDPYQAEFTDLWWQYLDVVYSLPPQPEDAPGWRRCVSDTSCESESCHYERWMDERSSKMHQLEKQLMQYFEPPCEQFMCMLDCIQKEAFNLIASGTTVEEHEYLMAKHGLLNGFGGPVSSAAAETADNSEFVFMLQEQQHASAVDLNGPLSPAFDVTSCFLDMVMSPGPVQMLEEEDFNAIARELWGDESENPAKQQPAKDCGLTPNPTVHENPAGQPWDAARTEEVIDLTIDSDMEANSDFNVEDWLVENDPTGTCAPVGNTAVVVHSSLPWGAAEMHSITTPTTSKPPLPRQRQVRASARSSTSSGTGHSNSRITPLPAGQSVLLPNNNEDSQVDAYITISGRTVTTHGPNRSSDSSSCEMVVSPRSAISREEPPVWWSHPKVSAPTEGVKLSSRQALTALQDPYDSMPSTVAEFLSIMDAMAVPFADHSDFLGDCSEMEFSDEYTESDSWPVADVPDCLFVMDDSYPVEPSDDGLGLIPEACLGPCPVYMYSGVYASDYQPAGLEQPDFELCFNDGFTDPLEVVDPPVYLPITEQAHASSGEGSRYLHVPTADPCSFPDDDAFSSTHTPVGSMVCAENLTEDQLFQVMSFLIDNKDVFCYSLNQLGTCTVGSHHIDTGDAAPIKQGFYKMPFKKYEQLKKHVAELLEAGIIRPSNSPWSSPAHLVPKRGDDGTRLVVDYRKLNSVTRKDAYPLPLIDHILHNIGNAKWFSVGDCMSGYMQVALDEESIARSAFITPFGLFEYLRTSFGLTAAPATFMRIINQVLSEHIGKHAFVYLDDLIVYSNTFAEHMDHLALIFESLRAANLKLNPKKCRFFRSEVAFLGFIIDAAGGLRADPRLLTAIERRKRPRNAKDAASFLGLTGYFRRFIKDYSKIAEPLTRVIGKTRTFEWGAEQEEAFGLLKNRLLTWPVLRRPDMTKPFIVHTDASTKALGAILCQQDDNGKEYVCAYHSKKLSPAERNYPISELECYAVVNAVTQQWADFLLGHPFTVVTDCSALQYLLTCRTLTGRLARWSIRLQEFMPFDIKYRKGVMHGSVDALTRDPTFSDDDEGPSSTQLQDGPPLNTTVSEDIANTNLPATSEPLLYCSEKSEYRTRPGLLHVCDACTCIAQRQISGAFEPFVVPVFHNSEICNICQGTTTIASDTVEQLLTVDSFTDHTVPVRSPFANITAQEAVTKDSSVPSTDSNSELRLGRHEGDCSKTSEASPRTQADEPPCPLLPLLPWLPPGGSGTAHPPVRICIDGNIGCGKSTVMAHLAQQLSGWHLLPEPVHMWEPLLAPFYEAPVNSAARDCTAAMLQVAVLNAYALATPDHTVAPKVVMERSPWSSLSVFLQAQNLPEYLKQMVYDSAQNMSQNLAKALPTALIFLDARPAVCMERVRSRKRSGELAITYDYLDILDTFYSVALDMFVGPKIIIDASQDAATVAAEVLAAIQTLSTAEMPSYKYYVPDRTSCAFLSPRGAPVLVHSRNGVNHPYAAQLLMVTSVEPTRADLPPLPTLESLSLTPVDTDTDEETTTSAASSCQSDFDDLFVPTPAGFIYDAEVEVPVLFQNGAGTFGFSHKFCEAYFTRFGCTVDPAHRVDNVRALEVYCSLSPWQANGPGANIQIAIVPIKAKHAIRVEQVHPNGSETVYVDTKLFAVQRCTEIFSENSALHTAAVDSKSQFPWFEGFMNEAYCLDGWIRLVRLRPLLASGLQQPVPRFNHNTVTPLEEELTNCRLDTKSTVQSLHRLRLTSCLPHIVNLETLQKPLTPAPAARSALEELHVLDDKAGPPSRQKRLARRAKTQPPTEVDVGSGPSVDPDLPCTVCGDPSDWQRMLLCSKCNKGFHTYCVNLLSIPEDDWYCAVCTSKGKFAKRPVARPQPAPVLSSPESSSYVPSVEKSSSEGSSALEKPPAHSTLPSTAPPLFCDADADDEAHAGIVDSLTELNAEDERVEGASNDIFDDKLVLHYLKTGNFDPDNLPGDTPSELKREMKRIRKRASIYKWDAGKNCLLRLGTEKYPCEREVPPPDQRADLVRSMHLDLGHLSAVKLSSVILQRYVWRGVTEQIKELVKGCEQCLRNRALFRQQAELRPLPPSQLWTRVHLDTCGPYPTTRHGNRYILCAICSCSKYPEVACVPTLSTNVMCRFFMNQVVANHGVPEVVVTDGGPEFQSEWVTLMQSMGVKASKISAYRPCANGQVESTVKAILTGLQKCVGDHPETWDEHIPMLLLGMRTARHSTTRFSPYFIVFGRHPVLPEERRRLAANETARPRSGEADQQHQHDHMTSHVATDPAVTPTCPAAQAPAVTPSAPTRAATVEYVDLVTSSDADPQDDPCLDPGTEALIQERSTARPSLAVTVEGNILAAQEKQKRDFRKRHHSTQPSSVMPVGSLVMMKSPHRRSKLHPMVEGPYRVVEYDATESRVLLADANNKTWPVHVSRITPWCVDQPK